MDAALLQKKVKRLQLLSSKLVEGLLAGNYRSVFKGPGIEFDEAREYVEGDDARLIDWNVSSRLGSPFTKTFREERELTLFMIADVSASLGTGSTESSRRETEAMIFAMLTFAAVQNNDRVGALFFSDEVEHWVAPVKGKKHTLRLIQDMLSFEPEGRGSDLAKAIRTVGESMKKRGVVVILSDFKTSGYLRDLSILSRRHDVIAIKVTDPLDQEFPSSGLVHLEDPETGRSTLAAGWSPKFRRSYREFWEHERARWFRECVERGVSPLEVFTDEDPASRIIQFFRRRA
mgnify:CR=1 FL=1